MKLFPKKSADAAGAPDGAVAAKSKGGSARFEREMSVRKINVLNETKTNICTTLNLMFSVLLLASVAFNVYSMLKKPEPAPVFSQIPKGPMYLAEVHSQPPGPRAASAPLSDPDAVLEALEAAAANKSLAR